MSWRDKHASTQRGRDDAERQLRQLERYIHDLPTPDQQAQAKTEISLCLVQLAAVNRAFFADAALRDTANNLYLETIALILQQGSVTSDYLNRLESTFNTLIAALDSTAAAELQALWAQHNPSQYLNQSARSSWDQINVASIPSAVSLASNTTTTASISWR